MHLKRKGYYALICIILLNTVGGQVLSGEQNSLTQSSEDPLRIMCLGDSITVGYTDNPIWKVPFKFGYRSRLYKQLKQAEYNFKFVGNSPQPWNQMSGDPSHGSAYKPVLICAILGRIITKAVEVHRSLHLKNGFPRVHLISFYS